MRTLKFRVCVQTQDDIKTVIYSNDLDSERHLINMNGQLLENYGKSWKEPFWETVFDSICSIQQFTGLKDSKDIDIYEGDLLQFTYKDDGNVFTGEVQYSEKFACFIVVVDKAFETFSDLADYSSSFKIVGNIFKNGTQSNE